MKHYFLYFAGFDGKTEQVGVATSDDQLHWTVSQLPIVAVGEPGEWDSKQTSNPSVIREDGRFRMWYQGVDDGGRYRIGYAESDDGIGWAKCPDVILERPGLSSLENIPKREGYHQPLVLRQPDGYRMYFLDHRAGSGSVRVAQSKDGLTWDVSPDVCLSPEMPWEGRSLHYPWVLHDDQQYVMWYTAQLPRGHWNLNRAVSPDGLQWQRDPGPVIDIRLPRMVSRGHFLIPRKVLRLFPDYLHPDFRAARPGRQGNPITLWLHDHLIYPLRAHRYISFNNSSVIQNGSYLMYFQAVTENNDLSIGTATSLDGIRWKPTATNVIRKTILKEQIAWCRVFDGDPHLLVWDEH